MSGRREWALVVLVCAAGAAVALLAAGRDWTVQVSSRPGPLADLVSARDGGDLRPWLPALGWLALAGAGALLATRRLARRLVGGVLVAAGSAVAAGGWSAVAHASTPAWPLLAGAGGGLVAVAGAAAVWRGGRWPAMGSRYERQSSPAGVPAPGGSEQWWSALDRGEDPTD